MEEIDLKELFQVFWEKKVQIFLIVAIFMVIGVIYSIAFVTPKYKSETTLLLGTNSSTNSTVTQNGITINDVNLNSKLVATYTELIKSSKILENVISNLGMDKSQEGSIRKNVSVTAVSDSQLIKVTVTNADPYAAQKIANEIAKLLIENVQESLGANNITIWDNANLNESPYNINHVKDVIIFAGIGVVVAIAYVLLLNMLDTTIKSEADIEKTAKLSVLASIPIYDTGVEKAQAKRGGIRK